MFLVPLLLLNVSIALVLRNRNDAGGFGASIAESLAEGGTFKSQDSRCIYKYRNIKGGHGNFVNCFARATNGRQSQLKCIRKSTFSAYQAGNSFADVFSSGAHCGFQADAPAWRRSVSLSRYSVDPELEDHIYGESSDEDDVEGIDTTYDEDYEGDSFSSDGEEVEGYSEVDEEEPTTNSGRFGAPRYLSATSRIMEAASGKLKDIFNWRNGEQEQGIQEESVVDSIFGKRQCHSTIKFKDEELLQLPYIHSHDVNMALDRWPENCFLRIRLVSYYPYLLKFAAERVIRGIRRYTNLRVSNMRAMPMRKKRWCLLSSPHVDKRSKDLFEIQEHVRYLDVYPVKRKLRNEESKSTKVEEITDSRESTGICTTSDSCNGSSGMGSNDEQMKFKGLLMVPMPSMVSFDYWFEEVHKPVKNRNIEKQFRKKVWVSKYFLYNYEKREKAEIIDHLTSPELYGEIPLRWKKHPCDYFAMQLGELKKLYRFVVMRKEEDDARRRFGIKRPVPYDIDEVRFVPNEEDRRCGYISSDDDGDDDISKELAALEQDR